MTSYAFYASYVKYAGFRLTHFEILKSLYCINKIKNCVNQTSQTTLLCDDSFLCCELPERDMAMRRIFWGFCINWFGIGSLRYVLSRSDFSFEFSEIFVIEKRLPTRRVGESTRLPIDTIFFKILNKSMVIVHFIPGFFFAKVIF